MPAGLATQAKHSGGVGAPPVPITRSCQELADDLGVALPAFGLLERDVLRYRPLAYLSAIP